MWNTFLLSIPTLRKSITCPSVFLQGIFKCFNNTARNMICMAELATEILTVAIPKKRPVLEPQLQYLLGFCSLSCPSPCPVNSITVHRRSNWLNCYLPTLVTGMTNEAITNVVCSVIRQVESQVRSMLTLKDAHSVSEGRCAAWHTCMPRSQELVRDVKATKV